MTGNVLKSVLADLERSQREQQRLEAKRAELLAEIADIDAQLLTVNASVVANQVAATDAARRFVGIA